MAKKKTDNKPASSPKPTPTSTTKPAPTTSSTPKPTPTPTFTTTSTRPTSSTTSGSTSNRNLMLNKGREPTAQQIVNRALGGAGRNKNPESVRQSTQPRTGTAPRPSGPPKQFDSVKKILDEQKKRNRETQKSNLVNLNPNITTDFYSQELTFKDGKPVINVRLSDAIKNAFNEFYGGVSDLGDMRDRLMSNVTGLDRSASDLADDAYQPMTQIERREINWSPEALSFNYNPQRFSTNFRQKDFTNRFTPEQYQVGLQEQRWDLNLNPEDIDYQGTVQDRQTVQEELFNLYSQDINRNFERRRQELETELLNQGLSPFSARFREKMEDLEREKNRAINEARQRAVADSGTEMLRRLQGQLSVAQERFGQRRTIQDLARQRALDLFNQQQQIEMMKQKAFEDYQNNRISAQQLQNQLLQLQIQDDEIQNRLNLQAHELNERMAFEAAREQMLAQQRNIENRMAMERLQNETAAQNFAQGFKLDELRNQAINEAFNRNLQANAQAIQGALNTQNAIQNAVVNPTPTFTGSPQPYPSVPDALAAFNSQFPPPRSPFVGQFPPM